MERTVDPTTRIAERGETDGVPFVVYVNVDGERWTIRGRCSGCGVCDGAHPSAGPPEGRLDVPVRPEGPPTWPGCTLTGEYV